MILLISNELDFTSDKLVECVNRLGGEIFRFNTEKTGDKFSLGLDIIDGSYDGFIGCGNRRVDLSEVGSIFYRRPKTPPCEDYDSGMRDFIKEESNAFIRWLCTLMKDRFWISEPYCVKRAESKFDQLIIARQLGFLTPKTCITNDPIKAKAFYEGCGNKIIVKTLRAGSYKKGPDVYHSYSTVISDQNVSSLDNVRVLPCVLQEYVSKDVELRVTVVGEEVFSCAIHSQITTLTKDDWRRYDLDNTPHTIFDLPETIRGYCVDLVKHFGLVYGAIDLILTPDGRYVFLEINPNGQWFWIEEMTGLKITESIARMLVEHSF